MLLAGQMHPRFSFVFPKGKRGLYPCWTSPCGSRHPEAAIRRPLRIRPAVMVLQMETDANGFIEQACNTDPYGSHFFTFPP